MGKGLGAERRVVSDNMDYTLTATSGATHLTAVYKKTDSETVPVIFFNGNGDEISKSVLSENAAITAPAASAVSGNPEFLGWKLAGDETLYSAAEVNEMTARGGRMVFAEPQFHGLLGAVPRSFADKRQGTNNVLYCKKQIAPALCDKT